MDWLGDRQHRDAWHCRVADPAFDWQRNQQGFMLVVRFGSMRLTVQFADARVNGTDQVSYAVTATTNSNAQASGGGHSTLTSSP